MKKCISFEENIAFLKLAKSAAEEAIRKIFYVCVSKTHGNQAVNSIDIHRKQRQQMATRF